MVENTLIEQSAAELEIREFLSKNVVSTGSRYWNSVAPELIAMSGCVDFDFVVSEDSYIVAEALSLSEKNSCPLKTFSNYDLDPSTKAVHCFGASTQLIVKYSEWYAAYIMVQSLMTPEFYLTYMWKSNGNDVSIVRERIVLLMQFFMDKKHVKRKK